MHSLKALCGKIESFYAVKRGFQEHLRNMLCGALHSYAVQNLQAIYLAV